MNIQTKSVCKRSILEKPGQNEQGEYPLGLHLVTLEDPSEELTVVVLSRVIIDLRLRSLKDLR